jgi:hypothetical protein
MEYQHCLKFKFEPGKNTPHKSRGVWGKANEYVFEECQIKTQNEWHS